MKELKSLKTAIEIDFEAISIGHQDSFVHTITSGDVEAFSRFSHDFNPLHLDAQFANSVGFEKPVVYGMLSASFISTMIGMLIPGKGALWSKQTLDFVSPAYVGDQLTVMAEVLQKSSATRSLVLVVKITNQNGQIILKGDAQVRVLKNKETQKKEEQAVQGPLKKSVKPVVLITGASGGIGAATAIRLAKEGYSIGLSYFQNEGAAKDCLAQVAEAGAEGVLLCADISKDSEVKAMVNCLIETYGRIDGFVHCASPRLLTVALEDSNWDSFQKQIDTQLKGAYLVTQELLPIWIKQGSGSAVFISTVSADGTPPTQMAPYVSAKAALSAFARCLAVEMGPKGIRSNIVSPGMTTTDLIAQFPEKAKILAKMNTPLRKLAEPEEVASAIVFLLGDRARHITGETIRVCGGSFMA